MAQPIALLLEEVSHIKAAMAERKPMVIDDPDPQRDGVVRLRCVAPRAQSAQHFAVTAHERTLGKPLHRLALTRLRPCPFHLEQDTAAQEAQKEDSLTKAEEQCHGMRAQLPMAARLKPSGLRQTGGGSVEADPSLAPRYGAAAPRSPRQPTRRR